MENGKLKMENYYQPPVCYEEDEIDLRELFATIWKHKVFIAVFVFIVTSLTIFYVLSKPNEYKVYTVLSPQEQSKSINLGGLGALASMAGVNIGGGSGGLTPEVAFQELLNDYAFMKEFIIKRGLDKKLKSNELEKDYVFAFNYNGIYKFLKGDSENKEDKELFDIYKQIKNSFSISTDKKTGLITISFIHPSRHFAYDILVAFLEDGTKFLVNKNLQDINAQIKKYQKELENTNNIELKSELAKLISSLIKQKVYINSSKYYKVKVVTDPYIPDVKDKAKPKRGLIVIVAFVTSFILAIFLVFFIEFIKNSKEGENENTNNR
ncbi:Wzz/FepE/Etk N-terminal domain-containing protein [Caminibacter profundus]